MGSACSKCDLEQIQQIDSDKWDEIVPVTPLRAGYEETRLNFQKVNCNILSKNTFNKLYKNSFTKFSKNPFSKLSKNPICFRCMYTYPNIF